MKAPIRRYLAAGLLIWVPLGVTLLIIKFLVDLMDQTLLLLPRGLRPETLLGFRIPGLGIVLTAVIVIATGMVVTNLLGRQMFHLGERLLSRIPLVSAIYTSVKKLTETVFAGGGKSFRKVVLIEYPRIGVWSVAFMTGDGAPEMEARTGHEMINVFVPTTPNPTSGFVLIVPRKDVIELSMSTDEALRFILSAGVVVPEYTKEALVRGRVDVSRS